MTTIDTSGLDVHPPRTGGDHYPRTGRIVYDAARRELRSEECVPGGGFGELTRSEVVLPGDPTGYDARTLAADSEFLAELEEVSERYEAGTDSRRSLPTPELWRQCTDAAGWLEDTEFGLLLEDIIRAIRDAGSPEAWAASEIETIDAAGLTLVDGIGGFAVVGGIDYLAGVGREMVRELVAADADGADEFDDPGLVAWAREQVTHMP